MPSLRRAVPLAEMTTLRIGGPAEWFGTPQSQDELVELIRRCRQAGVPYRVLGRGSNLLIDSDGVAGCVLRNAAACDALEFDGANVRVGSSVSVQRLILACAKRNLGGIEYLYSVPASVGGAIFMNAGRGKAHGQSIADHVRHVEVFDGRRPRRLSRRACRFGYRRSVFHDRPDHTVLAALLRLTPMPEAEVRDRIRQRSLLVKDQQDNRLPNAGTVFKGGFVRGKQLQGVRCGGAAFSTKTKNWIVNDGAASSQDVRDLLDHARREHLSNGCPEPELEWIRW